MNDPLQASVPSSLEVRAMLEEMVVKDLRVPTAPDEEIDVPSVHDRYLVGMLAPRRQHHDDHNGPANTEIEDEAEDTGGDIPPDDPLAVGGVDSMDEGATELTPPQPKAIFPSSFGMTFSVHVETTELQVTANWGQYLREPSEHITTQKGEPKRVWKRYPRGGKPHTLKIQQGSIRPFDADYECPDVRIEGVMRKRDDHWSVTIFLVNQQEEPKKLRDTTWVFQPELIVEAAGGGSLPDGPAIFHKKPSRVDLANTDPSVKAENDMLNMLYRRHVEFAVGHGVGVHVDVSPDDPNRAVRVSTRVIPKYEVPKTDFPDAADAQLNPAFRHLEGLVRDMYVLAETPADQLRLKLEPLVTAYEEWIDLEAAKIDNPDEGLEEFRHVAENAIDHCRRTLDRIRQGIELLDPSSDQHDPLAAEAFRFMNRAMWLQRTHTIFSERVRRGEKEPDFEQINVPLNRSWRPFQLAFVLLNLPGITRFDHPERGTETDAIADLLWFPTGGGKTEAYLGLTAYTLGLRRLQGVVEGRNGENGVTVLMRYTLRLLTLQQFQRATALICACEDIRRDALAQGDNRWGRTLFRIGLWVGSRATPNTTSHSDEAVKSAHGGKPKTGAFGGGGSPHQLTNCPWCGTRIDPGKNITVEKYNQGRCRTLIYCGDRFGQCRFSRKGSPDEGLPVLVVDEEIYRNLPSLLITTVDKFAQMPWNGATEMLFGQVDGICQRHGFRSPEIEDKDSHTKSRNGLPAAKTVPANPLRPPDLIIQDELHLISRPLGTLVGLYETAIDKLCTWQVNGKAVRPKVIASTATIRRATEQIHSLFLRKLSVFPPPGLDVQDNFFSLQRPCSEEFPGPLRERIYLRAPGSEEPTMAGVLIYTAAPDSEGTLGGLASLGEPHTLERHLDQALDAMRLCASDPLCAEHHPYRDGTTLHGASCHACLFAPETSCERGNKYLDRTVLVPTVDQEKFAYFDVSGENQDSSNDDNTAAANASTEESDSDQLNLYDLLDHGLPDDAEAAIRLPDDVAKALGLSPRGAPCRFADGQAAKPEKNEVVIIIRDQMKRGDEKVSIACGKIWWQRHVNVDSGEATVAVMVRSAGTPVCFTLTDEEWETFQPVAVLKQKQ